MFGNYFKENWGAKNDNCTPSGLTGCAKRGFFRSHFSIRDATYHAENYSHISKNSLSAEVENHSHPSKNTFPAENSDHSHLAGIQPLRSLAYRGTKNRSHFCAHKAPFHRKGTGLQLSRNLAYRGTKSRSHFCAHNTPSHGKREVQKTGWGKYSKPLT